MTAPVGGPGRAGGLPPPGRDATARAAVALPCVDLGAAVYQMKLEQRDGFVRAAKTVATGAAAARDHEYEKVQEANADAAAKQREAEKWGKIVSTATTVATIAAAVAAVCCTGGAGAPLAIGLAGTALSASAPLVEDAYGEDAGKAVRYTGIALSLLGGGMGALSSTAASEGGKQAALTASQKAAAAIATGAQVSEGGARVAQGYAIYRQKNYEADVVDAHAASAEARARMAQAQAETEDVVALLKEVEASARRALRSINAISDTRDEANRAVLETGRRMLA